MSVMLPSIDGKSFLENPTIKEAIREADTYEMAKPIHRQCTNVYQTKDGRWFHLHGSMNATVTMKMLGVPEQDVTTEEARAIYAKKVAEYDAETLDTLANKHHNQAGVICNTPEEFFASPQVCLLSYPRLLSCHTDPIQGKAIGDEPLYTSTRINAPRKAWPSVKSDGYRPLAGIKVVDFSRVIAAPAASKLLAVLGADVIKVSHKALPDIDILLLDMNTGKRDVNLNLKTEAGKQKFTELVASADILIDGFRPAAFERLGFNSKTLREINPSLIYMRENCYGFKGPEAYRSGWQQISDCLVGLAWLQGKFLGLNEPVVPLLRKY